MLTVNMLEAKSTLSQLVATLESGSVREIVIARNGKPAARLVPIGQTSADNRLGVARGKFRVPESIDRHADEIAQLFGAG